MNDLLRLLRGIPYIINEHISIKQPTLDEIFQYGEQKYFSLVKTLTATPSDIKSTLFDRGIDYCDISDFQNFILLCNSLSKDETSILIDNVSFNSFALYKNKINEELVFGDVDGKCVIDEHIYTLIVDYLRDMHGFKKNVELAANEITKQFLIEEDRDKIRRYKNNNFESMLYPMILAAVNCEEFKYNFDTVWTLPISVFLKSVHEINRYKNIEYTLHGISSGCIDTSKSKINFEDLSWIKY